MKVGNIGIKYIINENLKKLKNKEVKKEDGLYFSPEVVKDYSVDSISKKSDVW